MPTAAALDPAPVNRRDEARTAYRRALDLAQQEPERRFFERRLAALLDGNL